MISTGERLSRRLWTTSEKVSIKHFVKEAVMLVQTSLSSMLRTLTSRIRNSVKKSAVS